MRIIPISVVDHTSGLKPPRFRICIINETDESAAIQIYDRKNRVDLALWHGEAARSLLHANVLPPTMRRSGHFDVDKNSVWHLMLAASAINVDIEESPCESLENRLSALGVGLRADNYRIAKLLFEYPGQHLSVHDVQCLFTLRWALNADRVPEILSRLCRLGVIQCIRVDADNIFYDVNIEPHLHLFDSKKRQLFDAPGNGVVRAAQ